MSGISSMTWLIPIVLLITLATLAVGTTGWILIVQRRRQAILRRALGDTATQASAVTLGSGTRASRALWMDLTDWLAARVPAQLGANEVSASRLVHAGYARKSDQAIYALLRVASLLLFPAGALLLVATGNVVTLVLGLSVGVACGLLIPPMLLNQMAQSRQWAIRRAIPDALDILVVCVEAGVPLDSALQRVARELMQVHPILSREILRMTRRVAAGMPREQGLQMLYVSTGVEELRGLATHLLQSERWGTSVGGVLRIYSEQVRHKRRTAAEKRAATASTRMLFPLMVFIFPTMFIVLLAPAVMQMSAQF